MKGIKLYFEGGKGIQNPVDVDGKPIYEGDTLTHCWFREDFPPFFSKYYPNWDAEKIKNEVSKPSVIVKRNEKGILFGEGIEEKEFGRRNYMHDFEFKYTKKINQ